MIVHLSRTLRMRPLKGGDVKVYRVHQPYAFKKQIVWLTQDEVRSLRELAPEPAKKKKAQS